MNPRLLTAMKWLGTGAQVVGVFALAGRLVPPSVAFGIMLVGSLAWSVAASAMRERAMLALNLAFTLSNLIGLWRWLIP